MGASCTQPQYDTGAEYGYPGAYNGRASASGAAPYLRPGTLVDLWSKSERRWLPGMVSEPKPSDPIPEPGAVFCVFDDDGSPGTRGKRRKWVMARDVATTIRMREPIGNAPQTDLSRVARTPTTDPGAAQFNQTRPPDYGGTIVASPPAPPQARFGGINASELTPGVNVEVFSSKEGRWMPARIGALHEAHVPKPDPHAVLVLFAASNGMKGSKWVRAQDVPSMLRYPPGHAEARSSSRGYSEPQTWMPPGAPQTRLPASPTQPTIPQTRPPEIPQTRPPEDIYPQHLGSQAPSQGAGGRGIMATFGDMFGTKPGGYTHEAQPNTNGTLMPASGPMSTNVNGYDAEGNRW
mmetsp:Transcript_24550/g.56611  ORF Transcript_24550/g.56611 Transcript_24550/m.56611 type:complete len:350 (-) Transcript_24550:138-1187(-)